MSRFNINGNVAIITGAVRGIGAATAQNLVESGANLIICSRSGFDLELLSNKVKKFGSEALRRFGRQDIVVNNVGGAMPNSFMETSSEDLEKALSV